MDLKSEIWTRHYHHPASNCGPRLFGSNKNPRYTQKLLQKLIYLKTARDEIIVSSFLSNKSMTKEFGWLDFHVSIETEYLNTTTPIKSDS